MDLPLLELKEDLIVTERTVMGKVFISVGSNPGRIEIKDEDVGLSSKGSTIRVHSVRTIKLGKDREDGIDFGEPRTVL